MMRELKRGFREDIKRLTESVRFFNRKPRLVRQYEESDLKLGIATNRLELLMIKEEIEKFLKEKNKQESYIG